MQTSESGYPSFKSPYFQELFRQIEADYEARPVTLMGVGCSGFLMAQEIQRRGLAARIGRVKLPRVKGPNGLVVEADRRAIRIFLADNRGRDVLVLDWKVMTGQRLHYLLDLLGDSGLASLKTAVGFDIRDCRIYPVALHYVGAVAGIAEMN